MLRTFKCRYFTNNKRHIVVTPKNLLFLRCKTADDELVCRNKIYVLKGNIVLYELCIR